VALNDGRDKLSARGELDESETPTLEERLVFLSIRAMDTHTVKRTERASSCRR
jgi:hypothetical protein